MSRFWKDGFWRTSVNGNDHWVEGHWVERDDWGRESYGCVTQEKHGSSSRSILTNKLLHSDCVDDSSFLTPNATCPVCGEPVFFYESPDGGRVFFDSLGPPWPKHPCIDYVLGQNNQNHTDAHKKLKTKPWVPFFITKIELFHEKYIKISGITIGNYKKYILYTKSTKILHERTKFNLCYILLINAPSYMLSTFIINLTKTIEIKELLFKCSTEEPSIKNQLKKALCKKRKETSPMELAFKKALK